MSCFIAVAIVLFGVAINPILGIVAGIGFIILWIFAMNGLAKF